MLLQHRKVLPSRLELGIVTGNQKYQS